MSCVQFPLTKKRGPKVRRGPCATIIQFPQHREAAAAEARLDHYSGLLGACIERLQSTGTKAGSKRVRQFPLMLTGEKLRAQWAWLNYNHADWRNENLDGRFEDARDVDEAIRGPMLIARACGVEVTEDTMRADIAKWRKEIEKRTQVKDWLERRGVNWDQVRTPEEALTFAFDALRSSNLPTSA